jgi:hypothetical protein
MLLNYRTAFSRRSNNSTVPPTASITDPYSGISGLTGYYQN